MFVQIFVVTLSLIFMTCLSSNYPPPIFIFGDSLVDPGNNNYLPLTASRANMLPNGMDFARGATGRFTNGRTIVDLIGEGVGVRGYYIPPYLDPATTGDVILRGVNYASGGGGILNDTGAILGNRINMDGQIDNFANTRQDIISRIGYNAAKELLSKALFSVTMGNNDFIANYLLPLVSIPKQALVPRDVFVAKLIARYELQLTRLYELGARKMVVYNIGPLGCTPSQREQNPQSFGQCVDTSIELAKMFNFKLKNLLDELNHNLPGSDFLYADSFRIGKEILQNYKSYGFINMNTACCSKPVGMYRGVFFCSATSTVCPERSKYFFWDAFHPSEAANIIIAKRFLYGDLNYISPKNIRQLMRGY